MVKSQVSRLLLLLLYRRKCSFLLEDIKEVIPINGPEKDQNSQNMLALESL